MGVVVTAHRIGIAATVVSMAAAGFYFFVYLDRWEWNRALISGIIFVAGEVAFVAVMLAGRLTRIERGLQRLGEPDGRVLQRLRETAPPAPEPFEWLSSGTGSGHVNVFVPVLLGAGIVLSGLAWLVERAASLTTRPVLERRLARQLGVLALPAGGLLGRPDERPDPFQPRS